MKLSDIDPLAASKTLSEESVRLARYAPIGKSPEFEIYMASARVLAALAEAIMAGLLASSASSKKEPSDAAHDA